jgi:hypothetical protein
MTNSIYYFSLHLNQKEWLKYYSGKANSVIVTTTNGLRVSIPANNFIKYTSGNGIYGFFSMTISPQNKIIGIQRIA